jgi:hypothetical protein
MAQPIPQDLGAALPIHQVTTYRGLFEQLAAPNPAAPAVDVAAYLGGYCAQEEAGVAAPAPAGLRDQTVYLCDHMPMTFLSLLPRSNAQVVQLVHRFMCYLDLPGEEPTGLDDTIMGLLGDVRPGMLPVVEIPGTAFHLAGASQVRVLTPAAMAMVPAPPPGGPHGVLGPYVEGAAEETELVRPRNLQLLPSKYASLLLNGDGLSPLRAYQVLHAHQKTEYGALTIW